MESPEAEGLVALEGEDGKREKAAGQPIVFPPEPPPEDGTPRGQPRSSRRRLGDCSLYVGDLLPEVDERVLFETFNVVGPVESIRVCRDDVTRLSLGYAYVNYHHFSDLERALDSMNFTDIMGKPCRIMRSQRNPSARCSGVGNIFVKNLHEGIDNKQLHDTFSPFGNIFSCKVVCGRETGRSKGYGYVQYETNEAAESAIEKLDGLLIDGKVVQVGAFVPRDIRSNAPHPFKQCFVKNLPFEWDEKRLRAEFEKFGEIASVSVSMGRRKRSGFPSRKDGGDDKPRAVCPEPKEEEPAKKEEAKAAEEPKPVKEGSKESNSNKPESLGFGFVNFVIHEAAVAAIKEMNDKKYTVTEEGKTITKMLYVRRAQKKAEREKELRAKCESAKTKRIGKLRGANLYVKNLDHTVTDDVLRDEFLAMGTITSTRVMMDLKTGVSKGFGFVCFSTPEEGRRAVDEMNGEIISGKPIYVALAQKRDVRRAQLEAQHNSQVGGSGRGDNMAGGQPGAPGQPGMMRGPIDGPTGGYPGAVPVYTPHPRGAGGKQPSYPMVPQVMGCRAGYAMQGGQVGPGGYGPIPMQGYDMMHAQPGRGGWGGAMGPGGRGPYQGWKPTGSYGRGCRPNVAEPGQQQPTRFSRQANNAGPVGAPPQGRPGMLSSRPDGAPAPLQSPVQAEPCDGAVSHHPQPPASGGAQVGAGPACPAVAADQLCPAALARATPEDQKNIIGNRLYSLVHQTQPELAGKITGILLELDNSELLHLLESSEALGAKIQEALQVLEALHTSSEK